jgi:hypothetical protein
VLAVDDVVLEELAHDALQFRANNLLHWHTHSSSHLLNGLLMAALQEGGGRRQQQQRQAEQVSGMRAETMAAGRLSEQHCIDGAESTHADQLAHCLSCQQY